MGLYTGSLANYYGGLEEQGAYQFVSITDIINNFRVAYVGEDKIISKISRADIKFHAMRGLQELSFDTLKSCKSLELYIPPNLLFPIPHDYVNYIKLTWTDANGKCHPINSCRECFKDPKSYKQTEKGTIDVGRMDGEVIKRTLVKAAYGGDCIYEGKDEGRDAGGCDPANPSHWRIWHEAVYEDVITPGGFTMDPIVRSSSSTWSLLQRQGTNLNGSGTDEDYARNVGARYGLDGKHANVNGSYWINCRTGKIHFSSNLAGKTVILEYISDHLGTDDEMKVHKFAEEAMYKHIAHSILNTRATVDRNIVATFKKERFAAIRSAKIRLSSIKLSEITQILRGKSKWIKH